MFAKEALETKDPEATFPFPVLLSEFTSFSGELVFIPVNNPDFHWSLLVYETKKKNSFILILSAEPMMPMLSL
jgi:hypothetical protein